LLSSSVIVIGDDDRNEMIIVNCGQCTSQTRAFAENVTLLGKLGTIFQHRSSLVVISCHQSQRCADDLSLAANKPSSITITNHWLVLHRWMRLHAWIWNWVSL